MNKFLEGFKTAVFTTKYVLDEKSPILHAYHFDDGSWQFNGSEENLKDEDYRVISLGEMLLIDESLDQLGDMEVGFEAIRGSIDDDWIVVPNN